MGGAAYQGHPARQRAALAALLFGLALAAAPALQAQPEASVPPIVLRVHAAIAEDGGSPAADRTWIDTQIAQANRIFASAGIAFVLEDARAMPEAHGRLEDRRDRHALGALMQDEVINWFVVRSLRDVDDPSRLRMGVHWRPAGRPGKHFVIVAAGAGDDVLAHELGHFFGNGHSGTPGNLMSYTRDRDRAVAFFDDAQIRRIRRSARRFLRTRELVP